MFARQNARRAAALPARAAQHEARAGQLDRDGKSFEANVERKLAEKYRKAAAKAAEESVA